jgi:DNA-binding transcriptional LysR family regulator
VELRQIECFVAMAEELHFSRAAERLFRPPSVVTETIKRLECELGVTLFNRTTRRVQLTPAGGVLLDEARHIRDRLEYSAERVQFTRGRAGSVGQVVIS